LLLRRSLSEPANVTYDLYNCPADTGLQTMARMVETRSAIKECFVDANK
jgi:hypothetical protein